MIRLDWLRAATVALAAAIGVMAIVAVWRYPAILHQPRAWVGLSSLGAILLVYATAALILAPLCRGYPSSIRRNGIEFGLISAAVEILNLALETWRPSLAQGAFSIAVMLTIFTLWGVAGALTASQSKSIGMGVAAAVTSAALCMLISVASGFAIELYISPPDSSSVAQWPEFLRSGWTDVRAFALANTLDSGFTHLFISPIVATVFGLAGACLARRKAAQAS